MRKIYLTEEQFEKYIKQQISESIFMEKDAGKFGMTKLKNVTDYLAQKARDAEDNDEEGNILRQARENGINIDSLKGNIDKRAYDAEVKKRAENLLNTRNEELNKWFHKYIGPLRSVYSGYRFNKGEEQVDGTRDENGQLVVKKEKDAFDEIKDQETRNNVINLRDFLEKEGLAFLYRNAKKPKEESVKERYGVTVATANCKTDPNKLNIDFSHISPSDIKAYYSGTRVAWINNELERLGYNVLTTPAGQPVKIKDTDAAWKGENGKDGLVDIARAGKLKQVAERYVKRTYGMDFSFGDGKSLFSFGNKKIDSDTIIINFSSAIRCPAWNECLLKDACYARTTEKNYDNTLNRNLRTNFIWEQTREDATLTELMLELIRSYIFNYYAAVGRLNKLGYRGKVSQEKLSKLTMAEIRDTFGEEVLQVLSDTKRASVVRLNEDGDFVGQWLVDTWDKWAEDFKLAGVTVAAYTCRALNYENVKNMILNVSQERLVTGQNAPAVARYFYAVEPEDYDALADTYDGPLTGDRITPIYRPLITDGEVCGYYYKCPCGRGKYKYEETATIGRKETAEPCTDGEFNGARDGSKKLVKYKGKMYRLVPNEDASEKVDCYKCRICYGRDNGEIRVADGSILKDELPKYVLVSVHGAAKDYYTADRKIAGHGVKHWVPSSKVEVPQQAQALSESVELGEDENSELAIKQITKNAVISVAEHMREKAGAIMEVNKKFNNILDRINKN